MFKIIWKTLDNANWLWYNIHGQNEANKRDKNSESFENSKKVLDKVFWVWYNTYS